MTADDLFQLVVQKLGSFSYNLPQTINTTLGPYPCRLVPDSMSSAFIEVDVDGETIVERVWLARHDCGSPTCKAMIDTHCGWLKSPSEVAAMKLRLAL